MRPRRKRLTRKDKQPDFGSTPLPSAIARRRVAVALQHRFWLGPETRLEFIGLSNMYAV